MYATERFFLVLNAGGVCLSAHRELSEAHDYANEVEADEPGEEVRVVPRWFAEANSEEQRVIESLMA